MACGGSRGHLRARRGRNLDSVESLIARISELVADRQELRRGNASRTAMEQNRQAIAHAQWDLSHALIERYLPSENAA